MPPDLVIGLALAATGYWLWNKMRGWSQRRGAPRPTTQALDQQTAARMRQQQLQRSQQERRRQQAAARTKAAARLLQVALLQVRDAPDFRRAASFAELAHDVPVVFRQRQFRRFRAQLVACLSQRLHAGVSLEQAAAGLLKLVTGLGIAAYETEYLIAEAQGSTARAPAPVLSFADQIRQSQSEHQQRVETIQSVEGLEPELREQLLELEQQRLRDQLLGNRDDTHIPGI